MKIERLILLEQAIQKAVDENIDSTFSKLVLACRDALGMKQYRCGEFLGVVQQRIGLLEQGFFRDMPSDSELERLHLLFGIDENILEEKAHQHVKEMILRRKVRVIHEPEEV